MVNSATLPTGSSCQQAVFPYLFITLGDYMTKLSCCAMTDIGKVRENNEDNFYANGRVKKSNNTPFDYYVDYKERKQYLYAVCDGMGGEEFGELASMIAVDILSEYQTTDIKRTIVDYVKKANQLICDESDKNEGVRIGTTFTLLYINNGKAISYNIGDSRVYLFRKNKLTQLSEDHTQAQRLVKIGVIKKEAVSGHRYKHKLTQHLGIRPDELIIEPYISQEISIKQNDLYLLCSDGLSDMVSEEKISEILSIKEVDIKQLANKLVSIALEGGGKDNVTVIVIKINEHDSVWSKYYRGIISRKILGNK